MLFWQACFPGPDTWWNLIMKADWEGRKASNELCDMQIYKKPENPLVGLSENR